MEWIDIHTQMPKSNKKVILKCVEGDEKIVKVETIIIDKSGNICYNGKEDTSVVAWMPLPKGDDENWRDPIKEIPSPEKYVLCRVENKDGSSHAEVHRTHAYLNGTVGWNYSWQFGGMYPYPALTGWMPFPEA